MALPDYELIIFDLDGTLAPSKCPLEADTADLLLGLLQHRKVAVISGGGYPQFQTQLLRSLSTDGQGLNNLYFLPTSGTRLYVWRGTWQEQYAESLSPQQKEQIVEALNTALKMSGYKPEKIYGEVIEDRDSQITFSALGQNAPLELKSRWDPDRKKRDQIVAILNKKIPEFDIRVGGTSSIDITRKGINKAYGIRKLEQYLNLSADKILFIGDALYPGGNDFPAKASGVDCIQVSGPDDVKMMIRQWLN